MPAVNADSPESSVDEGGLCNCGAEDRQETARHAPDCCYVTQCHSNDQVEWCMKDHGHADADPIHVYWENGC